MIGPEELSHAIIYQVFTRNFSEAGTFEAVRQDLKRIHDLGTDILWFTPIHPIGQIGRKGSKGSPYAIQDYRAVHPERGTLKDFKRLIRDAHESDMRVMMDVVFHHTSRDSVLVREHPEWFFTDSNGRPTTKIGDWSDVYDLDFSNPQLREYLIATLEYWIDQGVDGFRCDVAPLVPMDFWHQAYERIKRRNADTIWLAESVHKGFVRELRDRGFEVASDPELHQVFQLTYDYDGYDLLDRYMRGERDLAAYLDHLEVQSGMYPKGSVKMRFLENHDRPRGAAVHAGLGNLQNWTAFMALLPGAFLIYMGQEYGERRYPDLFEHTPVHWKGANRSFYPFFAKLMEVSRKIKTDSTSVRWREISRGLVELRWTGGTHSYRAILNLEDRYGQLPLPEPVAGSDMLTDKPVDMRGELRISKEPIIIEEL